MDDDSSDGCRIPSPDSSFSANPSSFSGNTAAIRSAERGASNDNQFVTQEAGRVLRSPKITDSIVSLDQPPKIAGHTVECH